MHERLGYTCVDKKGNELIYELQII